ncbi:S24 family peptidase [Methylobacterium nodulans]|uniref:Peptidase S24/S26 domain-containing protein n=1 Tax=Methylobacterium nodulans (strain LMG 21967 / CNCM I-2342 / ORS 2060) TaxID=460265 RepID=B8ID13_METNO|nr:helix-turn-helix transcriptional regulator [Methylobacterium nodulans]ACL59405.1 peptidase S24/S26 domain-containing protein [Methylobacterium nodulans ORS 2060]
MLSHERIWLAIDHLAQRHGLTPSGLARRAGLDATSFNRSKRIAPDGRKRWPSTESLAKILTATGASLDDFLQLVEPRPAPPPAILPLIGSAALAAGRRIGPDGRPAGAGWEEMEFPDLGAQSCFAIEVQGEGLLPLYHDGDVLVVCATAPARRGDRTLVCLDGEGLFAADLRRRTVRTTEFAGRTPGEPVRTVPTARIAWMARVMWVRH